MIEAIVNGISQQFSTSGAPLKRILFCIEFGSLLTVACGMLQSQDARGVSVEPRKGRAVIFWSQTPEGKEDPKSLHGSCDVVSGVKWSATKWIRTGKFV